MRGPAEGVVSGADYAAVHGGCGGKNTAAVIHLRRTQGTVSVSNSGGKDVMPLNNMILYSGYGVGTQAASCAWIDLDDVKLTKLDQNSEIAIEKEGKALSVELRAGSLFFNVTEPLEDDETLDIRTSTMLVGIRGTSGWVEDNSGLSRVYILEGKVECSAGGRTVQVSAGQMAELTADGELTVREFDEEALPAFVQEELDDDSDTDPGFFVDNPPWFSRAPEATAAPNTPEPIGTVTSNLDGNGVLTVSCTGGRMPDYHYDDGYDEAPWYGQREQIRTVKIDDGITTIGTYSFKDCVNLTSVTIPDSVTEIRNSAFLNCSGLESVSIPDSVTSIGFDAFNGCTGLTGVKLPGGITRIFGSVFEGCSSLESVTIPDSVTYIDDRAFYGCTSLTAITIPDNVTRIGYYAFNGCTSLASVSIGSGVTDLGWGAFMDCRNLTSVTIPDGVTSIEQSTFSGCRNLSSVTISSGVTSIGQSAFWECSRLTGVTIPDSVIQIGKYAFYNCSSLTRVTIGSGVTSIGGAAFSGCQSLTNIIIPDGVTSIEESTFSMCAYLTSVTIPESVTSIGNMAFDYCSSLKDVYYGGSERQWGQIDIGSSNNELVRAYVTIHYNS